MLDDIAATDPIHVVRRIGTELAPEARRHLEEALAGADRFDASTRRAMTDARRCIELLEAQVRQLQGALESRIVIEQAKGVIAARSRRPVEEGFDVLRQRSQLGNRKLRDIAAEIVASVGVDGASG